MGGFNKHVGKQIMKHKTRYAEEIMVQNKNKTDDVKGLDAAYSNVNGTTRIGNTLYIGGTNCWSQPRFIRCSRNQQQTRKQICHYCVFITFCIRD